MRSMSLVVDLIDLVTKHKSGELRCPATALICVAVFKGIYGLIYIYLTFTLENYCLNIQAMFPVQNTHEKCSLQPDSVYI